MNAELERLVRKTAILADQKFKVDEGLHPLFYCRTDKGQRFIFDPDALGLLGERYDAVVKQAVHNMAEILFAARKIHRYCYISEAWMLTADNNSTKEEVEEIEKLFTSGGRVSDHPKRVEVILYEAEDIEGNRISAYQSIIRPAGQPPYLHDDLDLQDSTEWETVGRFTHLLDFRKWHEAQPKDK